MIDVSVWRERAFMERERAEKAEAAIERVRALHVPVERGYLPGDLGCQECGISYDSEVWTHWPCDTIKALDGES